MNRKLLGRYIVTAPHICHGQPTFRGTRIMHGLNARSGFLSALLLPQALLSGMCGRRRV